MADIYGPPSARDFYAIVLGILALGFWDLQASAQSVETKKIGAVWFSDGRKLAVLAKAGDMSSDFLFGECDAANGRATVTFDIAPELFADALTAGQLSTSVSIMANKRKEYR